MEVCEGKEDTKENIENIDASDEKTFQSSNSINFSLVNVEDTTKNKKKRIFGVAIIAGVVMAVSSISAVLVVNSNKEDEIKETIPEPESELEIVEQEIKQAPKLPIYSEEAKIRMQNIYKSDSEEKIAYLTFDDGPSNNITPQILEILKNEEINATFFVLGSRVETHPELVRQEYEAGHYIANHGYSHNYTGIYSSKEAVLDEYNRTENIIKWAIGNNDYSSHLFRFPGGSEGGRYKKVKNEAKELLNANEVEFINWNALSNDAVGKPTYESLISDLFKTASGKNKIVVLMHDSSTKQLTADSLTEIIHKLKEQGYIFKNFYDIMY